ncbi:MAG: NADP-specific glutamate dehydrogenase [Desulfobacterales bacterium]
MKEVMNWLKRRDPEQREFHQAVGELLESVKPVLDRRPEYRQQAVIERLTEPERTLTFRVPWVDDQGRVQVNRGYRVEMNSAIGPYKGGLRFHPSVNLGIFKLLAFEQVFKNALTTLPIGAARGGSDFDPKGKSDFEVMRFCQSFMAELARHIGPDVDIPEGGLGVGAREIGYLFGAYKKQRNEFSGVMTGKGLEWGGSRMRPESTGYGVVYFAAEMLAEHRQSLEGRTCLVSGSGNVAQYTAEKLVRLGAKVLTLSDSSGFIYDEEGIDAGKLAFVKRLKNLKRGRIQEYVDKYSEAQFLEADHSLDHNPLWSQKADFAFPCSTENEINAKDAANMVRNGVKFVCEAADMPSSPEAVAIFQEAGILFAPSKAANAGGVAVSCLEMAQNRMLLSWSAEEVDQRLRTIMSSIYRKCRETAAEFGSPDNIRMGADITGFLRVVNAMQDQGII